MNSQKVILNYYLDMKTVQLPFLILAVLLIGSALGVLVLLPSLIKNKNAARHLKHNVR